MRMFKGFACSRCGQFGAFEIPTACYFDVGWDGARHGFPHDWRPVYEEVLPFLAALGCDQ